MTNTYTCPNCQYSDMRVFYQKQNAPSHSVVLLSSYEQAINYLSGDIDLAICNHCGFICNVSFDSSIQDYSTDYEATQSYSPTFNKFAERIAKGLIEKYDLHNKDIIEIGCGQGEFLKMLCDFGDNNGVGFDPAYREESDMSSDKLTFIADYYSEKYTTYNADFVVCKMTLEHIQDTLHFVKTVRRSLADRFDSVIYFQIPNGEYVISDVAFWDVYYEHVSYFSFASLRYVFECAGFDVLDLYTDYDDQYLMIEAKPRQDNTNTVSVNTEHLNRIKSHVQHFEQNIIDFKQQWAQQLMNIKETNQKAVIWGSGSKGVAFLTTLGITDEIRYCVDINPRKHGMFMAGTGQEIVAPKFLKEYQPDIVIVMNPIYVDEIQSDLEKMGLSPQIKTIDNF